MRKDKLKGERLFFYEKASYQTVIDFSQIVAMSRKGETKRKISLHGLFFTFCDLFLRKEHSYNFSFNNGV